MFQLHSTPDVIAETVRVQRRNHPRAPGRVIAHLETRLRANFDEVMDDFPGDIEFSGQDEGDYHVHAAATYCRAEILVTNNARDFGNADELNYDIYTPDEFLCLIADSSSQVVRVVTGKQNKYWSKRKSEGMKAKSIVQSLEDSGCPEFAKVAARELVFLSGMKSEQLLISKTLDS